jgi:hypothetical protein
MGHTSTAMSDDYTHTPADTKQKAVDTLQCSEIICLNDHNSGRVQSPP